MYRAIEVGPPLTNKKLSIIKDILREYRKTTKDIANYQWILFFKNGSFNRKANIKHVKSNISERYKHTIQYHVVVPMLDSFVSNLKNRFTEIVKSANLAEKSKKVLLYLNRNNEWLVKKSEKAIYVNNKTAEEYTITEEEGLLAEKIFKHMISKWQKPRFNKVYNIVC